LWLVESLAISFQPKYSILSLKHSTLGNTISTLSEYVNLVILPNNMRKLVAVILILVPALVFWPVGYGHSAYTA